MLHVKVFLKHKTSNTKDAKKAFRWLLMSCLKNKSPKSPAWNSRTCTTGSNPHPPTQTSWPIRKRIWTLVWTVTNLLYDCDQAYILSGPVYSSFQIPFQMDIPLRSCHSPPPRLLYCKVTQGKFLLCTKKWGILISEFYCNHPPNFLL